MAVEAIGIYPNKKGTPIFNELAITPSMSAPALEFRFATQSNSWIKANVWVTVDIVRKAGNEAINGYAYKGDAGAENIPLASFTARGTSYGNYVWGIALSDPLMSGVASLLGTLTYSARSYDAIRLTVEVRVIWGNNDGEWEKSSQVCYIGFKPNYVATDAYYEPEGLAITYTASGWSRPNDRWENNNLRADNKVLVAAKAVWGTVGGSGKLVIPGDKLRFVPKTGDRLVGSIRMVGSWQDVGAELGTLVLNLDVQNLTQVDPPTITATADGDHVDVKVTASDGDYNIVSMVGSTYSMDRAVMELNDTHSFYGVPCGSSSTWQAVAIKNIGGVEYASDPSFATAGAVTVNGISLSFEDGTKLPIPYNASMSRSAEPETETVKLAGRERPTVGFGEGGEVSWNIRGTIVTKQPAGGDLTITNPDDVVALPFAGLCMIRDESGGRAQVYIKTASVTRPEDSGGGMLQEVNISASEVA